MEFVRNYFLLFIMYSFIGWVMEIIFSLVKERKIVNRGFLMGPYCPIYGVGCLSLIFLLSGFKNNPPLLFFMSMIICSILEYFTSYFMEKLFNARWWDYTHYKFNLNGRICAETMIPFGILGSLIVYFLNPFLLSVLNMRVMFLNVDAVLLGVIFVTDVIISFKIISNVKVTANTIYKDSTLEITTKVRQILAEKSYFHNRLVKAFPNMDTKIREFKSNINEKLNLK